MLVPATSSLYQTPSSYLQTPLNDQKSVVASSEMNTDAFQGQSGHASQLPAGMDNAQLARLLDHMLDRPDMQASIGQSLRRAGWHAVNTRSEENWDQLAGRK